MSNSSNEKHDTADRILSLQAAEGMLGVAGAGFHVMALISGLITIVMGIMAFVAPGFAGAGAIAVPALFAGSIAGLYGVNRGVFSNSQAG